MRHRDEESLLLHLYTHDADEDGNRDYIVFDGVVHYDQDESRWGGDDRLGRSPARVRSAGVTPMPRSEGENVQTEHITRNPPLVW